MQVINSASGASADRTADSVSSGSPQAAISSPTKPTACPWRKRPWLSSRAAGATAPVRTRSSAASMAFAFSSAPRWDSRLTAPSSPACCEREATTRTCLSDSSAARSAAMITLGLLGSTTTSSAGTSWIPARSS